MLKMVRLFSLFFLCLVGLTAAGQESIELINLYDSTPMELQALSHSALPIAVSVNHSDLKEISSSVIMAESWLRTNVLSYYPATKITTIVVGNSVLCNKNHEDKLVLVLPSLKNIYHSLTRWGLEKDIKVSAFFSSDCFLYPHSALFRDEIAETVTKPILHFLQNTNSTYSVNPPPNFSPLSDEGVSKPSSHSEFIKKLGFFELKKVNVVITNTKERKHMSRKLSFIDSKFVEPFPARPTPLPEISPSPLHSSIGYFAPTNVVRNPLSPLAAIAPPPSMSFSFPPELSTPVTGPASPPFGFTLPPCNPLSTGAPVSVPVPAETGVKKGLWCVAKPSVPADTLQEAMDYACGQGGADCEEIRPHGNCYNPDTIVAHASYAFNNYWQKNKRNGGTCNFGGTAMIINADPSFLHCRFVLS